MFGINNVKHFMEQSPKYNFEDIDGFSAFLREDGTTAEDIQIEIRNSVNIVPKGSWNVPQTWMQIQNSKSQKFPNPQFQRWKKLC